MGDVTVEPILKQPTRCDFLARATTATWPDATFKSEYRHQLIAEAFAVPTSDGLSPEKVASLTQRLR